jgi:alpha-galactosidase
LKFLDAVAKDLVTGIMAIAHFSVYVPLPVLRSTVEVQNTSASNGDVTLQLVSLLVLGGVTLPSEKWWKDWQLHFAYNAWFREAQCQNRSLPEVGLDYFGVSDSFRSNFAISNQGSFSTLDHLPMGALCRSDGTEHNGSQRWEIGDYREGIYLNTSGPTN